MNSEQVHRVFLNELGDIRQLPLWVALMVLTTEALLDFTNLDDLQTWLKERSRDGSID